MAGDLHEISRALGNLEAKATSAEKSRAITFEKLDAITAAQAASAAQMATIAAELARVNAVVVKIQPEVAGLVGLKNKALGAAMLGGLILSAAGAGLATLARRFFSGGTPA